MRKNYMKLIGIGMIGNYNYIGTSLKFSIQELKSRGIFLQFLQLFT